MYIADPGIGAGFGQVLLETQKGARKFDRSARRPDGRCNTELACALHYHAMIILLSYNASCREHCPGNLHMRFLLYRLVDVAAPNIYLVTVDQSPSGYKMTTPLRAIPATLIPGDGIGPEIVSGTVRILDALGSPFEWDTHQAGVAAFESHGDPLPQSTLDSIRRTRLALKGPLTTPIGGGFRSSNVRLREEFTLFGNVRPVKTLVPSRYNDIDLVLIRENLGGFYVAHDYYIPIGDDPRAVAVSSGVNSREACTRIARFAFDYAIKNGRKKITIVHKANILKALSGLFLEASREVAKDYAGQIEVNDMIVDACAMQLVLHPWQFDMLLCTNLFGDILSDLISGLVGGLGMAPGANIGHEAAIFEAVHGSAPDIAGKGIANPVSLLLSSCLMLEHVGQHDTAQRLRKAIDLTLNTDYIRTRDLHGAASTEQFCDRVIARLQPVE